MHELKREIAAFYFLKHTINKNRIWFDVLE